jgi:2'-5' RNA ligase
MAFLGIKIPHEVGRLLKSIEVPGKKEPDSEYHITIAFFGDDWPVSDAAKTLETTFETLKNFKPFKVKTQKITCFPKGEGGGVPILAKVESEELHKLEKKLKAAYDKEDIEFSKTHKDFKPHITLSYSGKEIDEEKIEPIEFMVHEIVLWCGDNGDDRLFVTFPLDGTQKKTSFLINKANVFYALAKDPKAFFKQTTDRRLIIR